jgi:hypothetical protein
MNFQYQKQKLLSGGKMCCVGGGKIGVGGGTKTNETRTNTTNIDNRSVVTNTLDAGAIEKALGFATRVSDNSTASTRDLIDAGQNLFDMAARTVSDQATKANAGYQNLFETSIDTIATQARQNNIGMQDIFGTAVDTISIQADKNRVGMSDLFDRALDFAGDAAKSVTSAFDKSSAAQATATGELKAAYADAKGTTDAQKQIILALLAVAGIAVAAPLLKGAR